jgi:hypothetical protein
MQPVKMKHCLKDSTYGRGEDEYQQQIKKDSERSCDLLQGLACHSVVGMKRPLKSHWDKDCTNHFPDIRNIC